jgi:polar amino acid transport system substrate-binding protein
MWKSRLTTVILLAVALTLIGSTMMGVFAQQKTPTPTPQATATPIATPRPISVITVGISADFRPFEFLDEKGKLVGFDVELMNALATAGGFEVAYRNVPFDTLLTGLAAGKFDVAISALTITDERKKTVAFTEPYFEAGQAFVSYYSAGQGVAIRSDNPHIQSQVDLTSTVIVGVQLGTVGDEYVTNQTDAKIARYADTRRALEALNRGDVDAVVSDIPVLAEYIKANARAGIKLVGGPFTREQYGIAVNKGKPEILLKLNTALAKIRKEGAYQKIFNRWFGGP